MMTSLSDQKAQKRYCGLVSYYIYIGIFMKEMNKSKILSCLSGIEHCISQKGELDTSSICKYGNHELQGSLKN
jgi:hypothetical protein